MSASALSGREQKQRGREEPHLNEAEMFSRVQEYSDDADYVEPCQTAEIEASVASVSGFSKGKGKKIVNDEFGDDLEEPPETVANRVNTVVNAIIPYGGMLSSGFNMASTCIGAGILGLPAAFSSVGIAMATVYLVLITAETIYSFRLLAQVMEKTGLNTFEAMAKYLLHPKAHFAVAIIRALHTFGGTVAYVVTVGDLMRPILESISDTPPFLLTTIGRKLLQSAFWLVFMFPLVIPREINSLRYPSAFGILFILFFCCVVVAHSSTTGLQADPRAPVKIVNTGNTAISGLGVFIFSFMNQINCLEVASEMKNFSINRFTLCTGVSMTICGILYYVTGLFGYLDFGDNVKGSILLHYNPIEEPQVFVSYIGVFVKVCASFGLVNNACRSALFPLVGWNPKTVVYWKYLIGAVTLAVISFFLGILIPNVNLVFGFTGGVCGGAVGFILPALFVMYAGNWNLRSVGFVYYVCTLLVLIAGVVAIVFGTGSTIYSAIVS